MNEPAAPMAGSRESQSAADHGTMGAPMRSLLIAIPLTLAALAGACGKSSEPPSGSKPSAAQVMWETKCAVCHGITGDGNGPNADQFTPRPHDYTDPAWQASVTDAQIREIILRGGANMGKSAAMPSHTLLRDRPEVLDELVKIVRDCGKHPSSQPHPTAREQRSGADGK